MTILSERGLHCLHVFVMLNKASQKAWKQTDQDLIAESTAIASSSEAFGNHLGAKRQRRPSVRLEEIGDRPAAVLAEKQRKRIAFFASSLGFHPEKITPSVDAEGPTETTIKGLRLRPLGYVNNGNTHEDAPSHTGRDLERHTAGKKKFAVSSNSSLVRSWQQQKPQTLVHDVNEGLTPSEFLKLPSKKGRNGVHKRGRPTAAASVNEFTSSGQLSFTDKVPDKTDIREMQSEEDMEARTPEGFRDCDLEASDYVNDTDLNEAKDLPISNGRKASTNGNVFPFRDEHEFESREAFEDGSLRQGHDHAERNKDSSVSLQDVEKGSVKLTENPIERKTQGTVSISTHIQTADKKQLYAVGRRIWTEADRSPHANKGRPILEANRDGERKIPTSNTSDLDLTRHQPPLLNGVRGWLQNLGLGKYAQEFETHEVDIEVLPLLTLDDLKEMGITAVGSRRKLFCAIQQLARCLLIKAD